MCGLRTKDYETTLVGIVKLSTANTVSFSGITDNRLLLHVVPESALNIVLFNNGEEDGGFRGLSHV